MTTTPDNTDSPALSATHIRLLCWESHHVQAIAPEQLRQIVIAPICTQRVGDGICGSAIWAVEHEGEHTRYVGRPPHRNWQAWADCYPSTPDNTDSPVSTEELARWLEPNQLRFAASGYDLAVALLDEFSIARRDNTERM